MTPQDLESCDSWKFSRTARCFSKHPCFCPQVTLCLLAITDYLVPTSPSGFLPKARLFKKAGVNSPFCLRSSIPFLDSLPFLAVCITASWALHSVHLVLLVIIYVQTHLSCPHNSHCLGEYKTQQKFVQVWCVRSCPRTLKK